MHWLLSNFTGLLNLQSPSISPCLFFPLIILFWFFFVSSSTRGGKFWNESPETKSNLYNYDIINDSNIDNIILLEVESSGTKVPRQSLIYIIILWSIIILIWFYQPGRKVLERKSRDQVCRPLEYSARLLVWHKEDGMERGGMGRENRTALPALRESWGGERERERWWWFMV